MNSRKPLRIMGFIVAAFAGLAIFAMSSVLKLAVEQYSWVRTSCTINASSFVPDQYGADSLNINYSYIVNGQQLQGSRYEAPSNISRSQTYYRQEQERLEPGSNVVCFYNPADKEQVVIKNVAPGDAAVIIIPIIFVIVGLGMLYAGFKPEVPEGISLGSIERDQPSFNWGRIVFFSLFILVGVGVTYLLFLMPFLALQEAKNWNLAKCTINDSHVSVSSSTDSKTGKSSNSYSLLVRYSYSVDGKKYLGDVYSPAGDRFIGSDKMYEIVNQLTKGTEVDCFIDPADSTRSALNRDFQDRMYFGLFPLIFVFAGILGMLVTSTPSENKARTMGYRIQSQSRVKNFISLLFITFIWNAIVGAVVYVVVFESDGSVTSYLPLIVAAPFLLIGVFFVFFLPYVFLQIFNPTLDLELTSKEVHLGQKFTVAWRLNGNVNRVTELTVDIKPNWERSNGGSSEESSVKVNTLEEFKRLLKLELIPPYKTKNQQQIINGRYEFDVPTIEKLKEACPLPLSGLIITARLSIPWFPDSQEMCTIPIYEEELDEDLEDELEEESEEDPKEV